MILQRFWPYFIFVRLRSGKTFLLFDKTLEINFELEILNINNLSLRVVGVMPILQPFKIKGHILLENNVPLAFLLLLNGQLPFFLFLLLIPLLLRIPNPLHLLLILTNINSIDWIFPNIMVDFLWSWLWIYWREWFLCNLTMMVGFLDLFGFVQSWLPFLLRSLDLLLAGRAFCLGVEF